MQMYNRNDFAKEQGICLKQQEQYLKEKKEAFKL